MESDFQVSDDENFPTKILELVTDSNSPLTMSDSNSSQDLPSEQTTKERRSSRSKGRVRQSQRRKSSTTSFKGKAVEPEAVVTMSLDDEDIMEVETVQCEFCHETIESHEEGAHMSHQHFKPRLEAELENAGWEAGQEDCPVCGLSLSDIVTHWGTRHQGLKRALAKARGTNAVYVRMKTAETRLSQFYSKPSSCPQVKIKREHLKETTEDLHESESPSSNESEDELSVISAFIQGTKATTTAGIPQQPEMIDLCDNDDLPESKANEDNEESDEIGSTGAPSSGPGPESPIPPSPSYSNALAVEGELTDMTAADSTSSTSDLGSEPAEVMTVLSVESTNVPSEEEVGENDYVTILGAVADSTAAIKGTGGEETAAGRNHSRFRGGCMKIGWEEPLNRDLLTEMSKSTSVEPIKADSNANSSKPTENVNTYRIPKKRPEVKPSLGNLDLSGLVSELTTGKKVGPTVTATSNKGRPGSQLPKDALSKKQKADVIVEIKCKICEKSFLSQQQFHGHLVRDHFQRALRDELTASEDGRCPNCENFVSNDINARVTHYGVDCHPSHVEKLYTKFVKKSSRSTCVFCQTLCPPGGLLAHVEDKHRDELNYELGLNWIYKSVGFKHAACPYCNRVETPDRLVAHCILRHREDVEELLEQYQRALNTGHTDVGCPFCDTVLPSSREVVKHMVLTHFQEELLSECGLNEDDLYACSRCIFTTPSRDAIILHYGIEHQAVNLHFTDKVAEMVAQRELKVEADDKADKGYESGQLVVPSVAKQDYFTLSLYLSDGSLIEYLSARRSILSPQSDIYNKLLELTETVQEGYQCIYCKLVMKDEQLMVAHVGLTHNAAGIYSTIKDIEAKRRLTCKLCHLEVSSEAELWSHVAELHFFDDILLEGTKVDSPENSIIERTFQCPDCSSLDPMRPREFVAHRQERHNAAQALYKVFQVKPLMLRCRMCQAHFKSLKDLKYHLGFCHLKQEMLKCIYSDPADGGRLCCQLCKLPLCDMADFSNEIVAGHVAVIHNYVLEMYVRTFLSRGNNLINSFRCHLCTKSMLTIENFSSHIATDHADPWSSDWGRCARCKTAFSDRPGYLNHVAGLNRCNRTLYYYFCQVAAANNVSHQEQDLGWYIKKVHQKSKEVQMASVDLGHYRESLGKHYNTGSSCDKMVEDPLSSDISMDYDSYSSTVTVSFVKKLPIQSFISLKLFDSWDNTDNSCFFCNIAGPASHSWKPPDADFRAVKDLLMIHLVETHFSKQISEMFRHDTRANMYQCCNEDHNMQTLIGHIKESHCVIQGIYDAVVPRSWKNPKNNLRRQTPAGQLIKQVFPNLSHKMDNSVERAIQAKVRFSACQICSSQVGRGVSSRIEHFLSEHFQPPYLCPCCSFSLNESSHPTRSIRSAFLAHACYEHNYSERKSSREFTTYEQSSPIPQKTDVKEESLDEKESSIANYFSPRKYQCLHCHINLTNEIDLSHHMFKEKHINFSWAMDSNREDSGSSSGVATTSSGRWFQKLDLCYKCSFCLKKASYNMSVCRFNGLADVFDHIFKCHMKDFRSQYSQTVISFCLCKLCNGFINLEGYDDRQAKGVKELEHYLSHGRIFLLDMGLTSNREGSKYFCHLCETIHHSFEFYLTHVRSAHREQLITNYREFPLIKLKSIKPLELCCICKIEDASIEHLSSHNKKILSELGIIESQQNSHKSSKIMCRSCKYVDTTCLRILEHFEGEHRTLFEYIKVKFHESNTSPRDIETPVISGTEKPTSNSLKPNLSSQIVSNIATLKRKSNSSGNFIASTLIGNESPECLSDNERAPAVSSSKVDAAKSGNKNGMSWATAQNCPICKEAFGDVLSETSSHMAIHFAPLIENWLNVNHPRDKLLLACPFRAQCGVPLCSTLPQLICHLGTEHDFFSKHIDQHNQTKRRSSTHKEVRFSMGSVSQIQMDSVDFSTLSCVHKSKCLFCSKSFVAHLSNDTQLSLLVREKKKHYLTHFGNDILNKYNNSFFDTSKVKCPNCNLNLDVSSSRDIPSKQLVIIIHLSKCRKDISEFIDKLMALEKDDVIDKEAIDWRLSNRCLVCKEQNLDDNTVKENHYLNHFFEAMKSIFSDRLSNISEEVTQCPYQGCHHLLVAEKSQGHNAFLRAYFIHIGACHSVFDQLMPKKINFIATGLSMSTDLEKHLSEPLWAIKASTCSICPASTIKDLSSKDRIQHYVLHFSSLRHVFGKEWEEKHRCFVCSEPVASLDRYKEHLLLAHFWASIHVNVILLQNNQYQCKHCRIQAESPSRLIEHLVNEEYLLDLEILQYIRGSKLKITKLYENIEAAEFKQDDEEVASSMFDADIPSPAWSDDHEETLTATVPAGVGKDEVENVTATTTLLQSQLEAAKAHQKPFVQMAACHQITDIYPACHDCLRVQNGLISVAYSCCCFEGFRKLRYTASGHLLAVGFLDITDVKEGDKEIWRTTAGNLLQKDISVERSEFILKKVGGIFLQFIGSEKNLHEQYEADHRHIIWKRPHPGAREMCDVCRTTIFNHHFVCSCCGFAACPDCFLARKRGTKYKRLGLMDNPYRTRKRFNANLDVNLWPVCSENRIHDVDKLLLTQMLPSIIMIDLLEQLSLFKVGQTGGSQIIQPDNSCLEIERPFSVELLDTCLACDADFKHISRSAVLMHLASHIEDVLLDDNPDYTCRECQLDVGSKRSLVVHLVFVHNAVDRHYKTVFVNLHKEEQAQVSLQVDKRTRCTICLAALTENVEEKRSHFMHHVVDLLMDDVPVTYPYRCEFKGCSVMEFTRYRLMVHVAIKHKQLDQCVTKYLRLKGSVGTGQISAWWDIPNCVMCNEKLSFSSTSAKRNHYLKHFKGVIEKKINSNYGNVLNKGSPYRCRFPDCRYSSPVIASFITHVSHVHRMIDEIIKTAAKSILEKNEKLPEQNPVDIFSEKCQVCNESFQQKHTAKENLKHAKTHYSLHFKDVIEEEYQTAFKVNQVPLFCPLDDCEFSTQMLDSDQYGHHKRRLLLHIGVDHQVFQSLISNNKKVRKNFEPSMKYKAHRSCKICFENFVPETNIEKHLLNHFRRDFVTEFPEVSPTNSTLTCPFCDYSEPVVSKKTYLSLCLHMGKSHGLFDKFIADYTGSLDYDKEANCHICNKDFSQSLAKSTAMKRHYASHFGKDMIEELSEIDDGVCPFCSKQFQSIEAVTIHVGTVHGFFYRLVDKFLLLQDTGDELNDSLDDDVCAKQYFSLADGEISSQCVICGEFISLPAAGDFETALKAGMVKHLDSHFITVGQTSFSATCDSSQGINKAQQIVGFSMDDEERVVSMFIPDIEGYYHPVIEEEINPRRDSSVDIKCISKDQKDVEGTCSAIASLTKCPYCVSTIDFASVDDVTVRYHLIRHNVGAIAMQLPLNGPFKCRECSISCTNRLCLLFHHGMNHADLDYIIRKDLDRRGIKIESNVAIRTNSHSILRYNLPETSKRYKTLCLVCGKSVFLSSVDKIDKNAHVSLDEQLTQDMALHLLKHVPETLNDLINNMTGCTLCNFASNVFQELKLHFVLEHAVQIVGTLSTLLPHRQREVEYHTFFLNSEFEVDSHELDKDVLENVGQPNQSRESPINQSDVDWSIITLNNLFNYHLSQNSWECDICEKKIDFPPSLVARQWKCHFVEHFAKRDIQGTQACKECMYLIEDESSFQLHMAFYHNTFDQELVQLLRRNRSKQRRIHDDLTNIQSVNYGRKRKLSDGASSSIKKIVKHGNSSEIGSMSSPDDLIPFEESMHCEICQTDVSLQSKDGHMFVHMKDELKERIEISNLSCDPCLTGFESVDDYLEHNGIIHGYAQAAYNNLKAQEIINKEKSFYNKLSLSIPHDCKVCGFTKHKQLKGSGLVKDYLKHMTNAHPEILDGLNFGERNLCPVCNIEIKLAGNKLKHLFIEHRSEFQKGLFISLMAAWKEFGSSHCELCSTKVTFINPYAKCLHLIQDHFWDDLTIASEIIPNKRRCLECQMLLETRGTSLFNHLVKNHQPKIKYLLHKSAENGEAGLSHTYVCPFCIVPIAISELKKHVLTHFFIMEVYPLTQLPACDKKSCNNGSHNPTNTNKDLLYGTVAEHTAHAHFSEIKDRHYGQIEMLFPKPQDSLKFLNDMIQLLRSRLCIICFEECPDNLVGHFAEHYTRLRTTRVPEEEPYECDLCDGFPNFPTYDQFCHHRFEEHCLQGLIKSLSSLKYIDSVREQPIAMDSKSSPIKLAHISDAGQVKTGQGIDKDLMHYPQLGKAICELLLKELSEEKVIFQRRNASLFSCPRCVFIGDDINELIVHFGEYHKLLDYHDFKNSDLELEKSSCKDYLNLINSQPPPSICHWCGKKPESKAIWPSHIINHLEDVLLLLPYQSPYLCPSCSREAGSRESLVRHFFANHWQLDAITFHQHTTSLKRKRATKHSTNSINSKGSKRLKSLMSNGCPQTVAYSGPAITRPTLSSKAVLSQLFADINNEDEVEEEHGDAIDLSLGGQLDRMCRETGQAPGLTMDFTDPNYSTRHLSEPGLLSLSPRHILTMQESLRIFPGVGHSWLCDGRLLHLHDAADARNLPIFQYQWARGQPVIISNSNSYLDKRLWHPRAFEKDFGHLRVDLINTLTGKTVPKMPLKWFWQGFSRVSHRVLDSSGTPMLLKLKDWPPDGDIAEYIPKRFQNLINDFPIQPYTLREGQLNLASFLPDYFLKPELGPKMYIAYGNALYNDRASTNLHLDMSDAVNLMVYVGMPDDCDSAENIKLVLEQVDEAGCDLIMRRRVREGDLPGALWHIFHPADTNKIRDLLNKVAIEDGKRLDPHDDPIHDQSVYLDAELRQRLYREYGVQGYAIIQCAGDTVFIPAGACHQVRNLHNCIKIAEDFVSPELANNCLHLTQEFRQLTEHHTNHEDKLQIKSLIYHSVKEALFVARNRQGTTHS